MARQALELHGEIEQAADLGVVPIFGGKLGDAVQGAVQRPGVGRVVGDQLGEPVDLAVGHLQHPAGVLEDGAGLQLSEGDDLGDLVGAVALLDVADHLAAPRFAEVDVEVRHRHALGIEEALEQQAEADRVEIGDGQRPGDDRAGAGAAAGADRNVLLLGPFDEVGDDQEIGGEAHADDDVDLVIEPVEIGLALGGAEIVIGGEPLLQAGAGIAAKLRRPRPRDRRRCEGRIGLRFGAANAQRRAITEVFSIASGRSANKRAHVGGGLDPGFGRRADPVVAVDLARLGDAEHGVMRAVEIGVGISGGVGRD